MTYQMSIRDLLLFKICIFFIADLIIAFFQKKKMQLKDVWYFNNETLMFAVIEKGFIS